LLSGDVPLAEDATILDVAARLDCPLRAGSQYNAFFRGFPENIQKTATNNGQN
jgi:hypothetical protein